MCPVPVVAAAVAAAELVLGDGATRFMAPTDSRNEARLERHGDRLMTSVASRLLRWARHVCGGNGVSAISVMYLKESCYIWGMREHTTKYLPLWVQEYLVATAAPRFIA